MARLLVLILLILPANAMTDESTCSRYRLGPLITDEIAIFHSLEEQALVPPPRFMTLTFRGEYAPPQGRGRSYPGKPYGYYPYRTGYIFQLNLDSGQPVPQRGAEASEYVKNHRTNRDFRIEIVSTWSEREELIPAYAGLPPDGSISLSDYEVIGEGYGMQEISFERAFEGNAAAAYAQLLGRRYQLFVREENGEINAFMRCHRDGDVEVPHCEFVENIDPFRVKVRLKRSLLDDLDVILDQSRDFVSCLMQGE